MNKRLVGLIVFALAVSGIASILVYRVLSRKLANSAVEAPETQVLVIARDVKVGAVLRAEDVSAAKWRGQVPNGAIVSAEKAEGRAAMVALHPGDLVLENVLAAKGAGIGLAVKIPAGMRAVAVRVNDVVVARTGQKFTHTFKLTLPSKTIINMDDKEPIDIPQPNPPNHTDTLRH